MDLDKLFHHAAALLLLSTSWIVNLHHRSHYTHPTLASYPHNLWDLEEEVVEEVVEYQQHQHQYHQ
jgi:hypothetical protein